MIRTIIVDDDVEMLNGLTSIISWEKYGFQIVGGAKNGVEALKLITALMPDVIITDITMPGMNGLELLREAKQLKSGVHGIIISCHEEFEYAREAILLEADEYIIKHTITKEALEKTIFRLMNKIQLQKKRQTDFSLAIRGLNTNRYAIYKEFFNDIIEGKIITAGQIEERAVISAVLIPPAKFRVISFFIDDMDEQQRVIKQFGSFEYCVLNIIEECLGSHEQYALFPYREDSFMMLLWGDISLFPLLEEIQRNIKSVLGVLLSICAGGMYNSLLALKHAVYDAGCLRNGYFYMGTGAIVTEPASYPLNDLKGTYKEFSSLMKQFDSEKLMKASKDILSRQYSKYEPSALKIMLNRLLMDAASNLGIGFDVPRISGNTFDLCKKAFDNSIRLIAEKPPHAETYHEGVLKALKYIDGHLSDDLSCEKVALYVNMNSSYFSRLFKREMQKSFSDYIMEKRIQTASELLIHSTCSVDEISNAIGIESVSYFYRVYKRITGSTPRDVRNKARGRTK